VKVSKRVLKNVRALNIVNEGSTIASYVTVSIGITVGKVLHTQNSEGFIGRADEALYMSKQNGRDQYTFLPMV
jgi:PleD family two-component response regulator